jgi:hypothetical protein
LQKTNKLGNNIPWKQYPLETISPGNNIPWKKIQYPLETITISLGKNIPNYKANNLHLES